MSEEIQTDVENGGKDLDEEMQIKREIKTVSQEVQDLCDKVKIPEVLCEGESCICSPCPRRVGFLYRDEFFQSTNLRPVKQLIYYVAMQCQMVSYDVHHCFGEKSHKSCSLVNGF